MSRSVEDDWVLDEAEALLDMDGRRERLELAVAGLQSGKSSLSATRPRATGSRSASETAAPGDAASASDSLGLDPPPPDTGQQAPGTGPLPR